ncbi:hypothetical protein BDV93DRAFT_518715, partial [Ceratobasidium sp. AG-I]
TLAHEATMLVPKPLFDRSLSYCKARTTLEAQKAWDNHWANAKRSGHVLTTLPNPPSRRFKRPEYSQVKSESVVGKHIVKAQHFEPTFSREVTSRLNQVILGHGFYGEYYERFKIDEDTHCPCGKAQSQSFRHVLLDCDLHSEPRMILRKISRSLNLKVLFGTEKGLAAVASFLASSSAFRK